MRGTQFAALSAFVAVAEHKNFTKAAAQLGLSPSTLSQTIRSLEEQLDVRLLNRTTRSVALTEAGERLLADVQPVLDGLDRAIEAVNAFRDRPVGTLRLSMSRPAAMTFVAPLLPQFMSQYPEIKLEISVDDTHNDIVSGRFDAGIRIGERIARDMVAIKLLDEFRVLAVAAPSYLARHPAPAAPEDLDGHRCVRLRWDWDGSLQAWVFEKAGRRVEVDAAPALILNDTLLVLNAVLDGIGVGYIAEPLMSHHIAAGRLVPLLDGWGGHMSGVYLYYSSRRQMPGTLRAFIEFIRRQPKDYASFQSRMRLFSSELPAIIP
jgi:DNA-binding transcriptional LysR family regulator